MQRDEDEDIDAFSRYQDIVDECLAGRTEGHKCPHCGDGDLECKVDEIRIRVRCLKCGKFFEGMMA
ncbi:MAG: hypothetical protein FJ087_02250 [Deltaproteobacteria bacterium]|nr:hypothetical protein [Deltaproteobacteria bacterium]